MTCPLARILVYLQSILWCILQVPTDDNVQLDSTSVNLEHGLGLLSAVARKGEGGGGDVEVDGIVNIGDQLTTSNSSLEMLIRNNMEGEKGSTMSNTNPLNPLQLVNMNQQKMILDPTTQVMIICSHWVVG